MILLSFCFLGGGGGLGFRMIFYVDLVFSLVGSLIEEQGFDCVGLVLELGFLDQRFIGCENVGLSHCIVWYLHKILYTV